MLSHSLKLYRENVPSILLLSFTIVFPLLIFQALLTNYVYGLSSGLNDSILADFVNGFLTLLFLVVAQVPFIQFTLSDTNGSENPLKDTYRTFLYRGFSVYVFAFIYTAMVMAGMILFILPGMALLILLFLTPYIAVLNDLPSVSYTHLRAHET